jgi:hypothetical protein
MRTESSVMVALDDLRRIESERVAEERAQREAEERRRRAEEARARAEAEAKAEERARSARELADAQAQLGILREKLERERERELDRERERERERALERDRLLELERDRERAADPGAGLRGGRVLPRGQALAFAGLTAAVVGLVAALVLRPPVVRERVVTVPQAAPAAVAPRLEPAPAPARVAAPASRTVETRVAERTDHKRKTIKSKPETPAASPTELLDLISKCKDDPACGADAPR